MKVNLTLTFNNKATDAKDASTSNLTKVTRETIRSIPLLAGISEEEIALVLRDLRIGEFPRRDIIIQKGSAPDSLVFLIAGQVQVVDVTEDGREVGLRILSPGEFFGEIAVISNCPRTASVVALTNAIVAFLPRALALHLFFHSPSIAHKMMLQLAEKIQQDTEFRSLLSIPNASKRVYTLLQSLQKKTSTGEIVIDRLPTHQEIAIMINTSRETVTRALMHLTQQGIIQKNSRHIVVLNLGALQQLVRDTP